MKLDPSTTAGAGRGGTGEYSWVRGEIGAVMAPHMS